MKSILKKTSVLFLAVILCITGLNYKHVKAVAAEKKYLVIVEQENGTWKSYSNLIEESENGKLMIKAKAGAKALGLTYVNNKKDFVIKTANKQNTYIKNSKVFIYKSGSKSVEKTASNIAYTSKTSKCNLVSISSLSTLVNYKYFGAAKAKKYGYSGIIAYSSYNKIPASIPSFDSGEDKVKNTDITAVELARLMGNGINLGNTMEAYGHQTLGVNAEPTAYETLWGQPVTTREMIIAMKEAGFDSIRIPVAWTNTMDFAKDDYTIKKAYLDRVEEIVNYALDADMYVVINDHWDGGWWGMFGSATIQTRKKAMDLYVAMWSQIAERFKDYSDKLIFESANEELGDRLNDRDICKDSGSLSVDECYEMTNKINQTFVDIIRKSGENNVNRFLLIAGYNTNIKATCDDRFKMPADSAKNRLLISVHYYDPWSYCGSASVSTWGSETEYRLQNEVLSMMTKFTKQGYGVVIGEYGVLPTSEGVIKENTTDYCRNILDNCDLYGYCPMLWDTSSFFIRKDLKIKDEGLAKLYKERSLVAQSSLTEKEIKENAQKSLEAGITRGKEYDANYVGPVLTGDEKAVAWIMYTSKDSAVSYSVGDTYIPTSKTDGVIATDVEIKNAGTYTVSLDFRGTSTGYADGMLFSAIGISNGELLFPGYIITVKEILINGKPYQMTGVPYTTSDDRKCTRVNLYNGWVSAIPAEARVAGGDLKNVSPTVIDANSLGKVETISVTFDYGPAK